MIIYGWGKDLKKVAYAGIDKCPNCKNYGHFWICEHSSHAKLYFLKVAKWNKKLLHMCETCERGWEIEDAAKDHALKRTIALPTQEHCLQIWKRLDAAINDALSGAGVSTPEATVHMITNVLTTTSKELAAIYQEDHIGYVAGHFVAYLQDEDRPA